MRGIVLAGGRGCRLDPMTKTVNKHLLPVYDRPMIEWSIEVLRASHIRDITIVSTPDGIGQLARHLGGKYHYRVQEEPGGIPDAILCAKREGCDQRVAVILGDNIYFPPPPIYVTDASPARCYLHTALRHDLTQLGVARTVNGTICEVVEKPERPPSALAVTGLYVLSAKAFDLIPSLKRSARGETEMADLLNVYAQERMLSHFVHGGFWMDAGTKDNLLECGNVAKAWIESGRDKLQEGGAQ